MKFESVVQRRNTNAQQALRADLESRWRGILGGSRAALGKKSGGNVRTNISMKSEIVTALWFGSSAALMAALIIYHPPFGQPNAGTIFNALLWSFVSGSAVGALFWRTLPARYSAPFSYAIAAMLGIFIGSVSLLVAAALSTLFAYFIGELKDARQALEQFSLVAFGGTYIYGPYIAILSVLSGIGYVFVARRKQARLGLTRHSTGPRSRWRGPSAG